jgi:serine/threonine protein kinase
MLHSHKFIHKDIKPINTLYSPALNKFILSDFGITHSVK